MSQAACFIVKIQQNARVVDQYIQSAQFLKKHQCGVAVGGVGHFQLNRLRVNAFGFERVYGFLAPLRVPRAENDGDALRPKLPGDFQADAFVCACHQCDFFV